MCLAQVRLGGGGHCCSAPQQGTELQPMCCDSDGFSDGVPMGLTDIDRSWSDLEAETQPNLELTLWLTSIVMEAACAGRTSSNAGRLVASITHTLFNAWCLALRSANVGLKERACRVLAAILREVLHDARHCSVALRWGELQGHIQALLRCIPVRDVTVVLPAVVALLCVPCTCYTTTTTHTHTTHTHTALPSRFQ